MKTKIWMRLTFLAGFFLSMALGQLGCVPPSQAGLVVPLPSEVNGVQPALFTPSSKAGQKPDALPGAEGFGVLTGGGRRGNVIEVTNLNNSGLGSLRFAVDADGPRIVVFRI